MEYFLAQVPNIWKPNTLEVGIKATLYFWYLTLPAIILIFLAIRKLNSKFGIKRKSLVAVIIVLLLWLIAARILHFFFINRPTDASLFLRCFIHCSEAPFVGGWGK